MEKKGWGPIKYTTFPDEMDPYKGHYAEYDKERASADDVPFKTWEQGAFRNVDRIKLIASIIEAPVAEKGCGMKIKDLTVGGLAKRSLNSATPPLGRKMLPSGTRAWIETRIGLRKREASVPLHGSHFSPPPFVVQVKKACLAVFPLHDHLALTMLQHKWLRLFVLPHNQPTDEIKVPIPLGAGCFLVRAGFRRVCS